MAEPLPSIYVLDPPELSIAHRALVAAVQAWLGSAGDSRTVARAFPAPALLTVQTASCPLPGPALLLVPLLDLPSSELLSGLRARWTHTCFLGLLSHQGTHEDAQEALLVLPELDGILPWSGLSAIPRLIEARMGGGEVPAGPAAPDQSSLRSSSSPPQEVPRRAILTWLRHSTDCLTRAGGWSHLEERHPAEPPRAIALTTGSGGVISAALLSDGGTLHQAVRREEAPELGILLVWAERSPLPPWSSLLDPGWSGQLETRPTRLEVHLPPDGLSREALKSLSEALVEHRQGSALTLRVHGIPEGERGELLRAVGATRLELLHEGVPAPPRRLTMGAAGPLDVPPEGGTRAEHASAALPPRGILLRLARLPARVEVTLPVGRPADTVDSLLTLLNQLILIPELLPKLTPLQFQIGAPLRGQAETGLRPPPSTDRDARGGPGKESTPPAPEGLLIPGLARSRSGALVSTPGFTSGALQLMEQLEQLLSLLREAGLASVRGVAQALSVKPTQVLDQLLSDGLILQGVNARGRLEVSLSAQLRRGGCSELVPVLTQLLDLEFWRASFRRRHVGPPRPARTLPDPLPPQAILARSPLIEVRSFGFDLIRVLSEGLQGVAHRRTHLLLRAQTGGAPPLLSAIPERLREQLELLQRPRTVAELREEARARGWELRDHNARLSGPEGLLEYGLARFRGIRSEKARPLGENVLPFQPPGSPRQILPFRKVRPRDSEAPDDPSS